MAHLPEHYDFNALPSQSMHTPTARCGACGKEKPRYDLEERYSFGVYAGRYCIVCRFLKHRDATDPDARFDAADAGEAMEGE